MLSLLSSLGLFALFTGGAWSIAEIVIAVIIVAAVVAIAVVAVRAMGLSIPSWVVQIFWIVVIAIVAILAIKIVLSL